MSEAAFGILAFLVVALAMTTAWVSVEYRRLELGQRKQAHKEKQLEAAITQHAAVMKLQEQSMFSGPRRGPMAS